MPILNDDLTLWEVAFRWNNLDPDDLKYKLSIPLAVKDSFRLMVDGILHVQLASSLEMDKWHEGSNLPPEYFIRFYIDRYIQMYRKRQL